VASANLDLVRSICAPWERGDFSSIEWADPKIEYTVVGGPTPGSWQGVAGMAEASRELLSAWDDFRIEVDEFRELDGEQVLVFWNFRGRGKTSGLDTEQIRGPGTYLFQIRGGKVVRLTYYLYRERALEDLGLSPEAAST
jgi:hypothetical protein